MTERNPRDPTLGELAAPDGRTLSYAIWGDPGGRPVVFFHGAPASRVLRPDPTVAAQHSVALVTISRPGYGGSTFQPARRVTDWPADVCAVMDHLGHERFAVIGSSAGGPYVAACAHAIPERLTRAMMVSSFGPTDVPGATDGMPGERRAAITLCRYAPWLLRPLFWALRHSGRDTERFFERYTTHNSASDLAFFGDPAHRAMFIDAYRDAVRHGVRGFAHEVVILTRPWGFDLTDISMDIQLLHGDADHNTPLPMAQAMADAIPGGHLEVLPGEGHLVLWRRWAEIIERLL